MSNRVSSLPNPGPRCEEWLAAIGVHTAEDLRQSGARHRLSRTRFEGYGQTTSHASLRAGRCCSGRALHHTFTRSETSAGGGVRTLTLIVLFSCGPGIAVILGVLGAASGTGRNAVVTKWRLENLETKHV